MRLRPNEEKTASQLLDLSPHMACDPSAKVPRRPCVPVATGNVGPTDAPLASRRSARICNLAFVGHFVNCGSLRMLRVAQLYLPSASTGTHRCPLCEAGCSLWNLSNQPQDFTRARSSAQRLTPTAKRCNSQLRFYKSSHHGKCNSSIHSQ